MIDFHRHYEQGWYDAHAGLHMMTREHSCEAYRLAYEAGFRKARRDIKRMQAPFTLVVAVFFFVASVWLVSMGY